MIVIIDPGHGGNDPGAVHGDYREKDQTLGIAKRLQVKLAEKNIHSILTRDKDEYVELLARAGATKKIKDNAIFISIHLNASKNHTGTGGVFSIIGSKISFNLEVLILFLRFSTTCIAVSTAFRTLCLVNAETNKIGTSLN